MLQKLGAEEGAWPVSQPLFAGFEFFEFVHTLSKSTGQEPAHPAADDSLS